MKIKGYILLAYFFLSLSALSQNVTIDQTTYTVEELIQDILIDSPCAEVSNIQWSTGTNFGQSNGIGFFDSNGGAFPFGEGIILSSGNAAEGRGPNNILASSGTTGVWPGDAELAAAVGITSNNATFIEFDFVPLSTFISFDFIMASEEYDMGSFECTYSDAFAFLLTDSGGTTTNLAVLPSTTTPILVTNIHLYNGFCPEQNPGYFGEYVGFNQPPIAYDGYTAAFTAQSAVNPGETYHIKLVISDAGDSALDSAVFLEAGSFNIGGDLGDDLTIMSGTAGCLGSSLILDTGAPTLTHTWYANGEVIPGETGSTFEVTEPGYYQVEIIYSGLCQYTDSIIVEFLPTPYVNSVQDLYDCSSDPTGTFNLTQNTSLVLGTQSPVNYDISYHEILSQAEDNLNPISGASSYLGTDGQIIYVRIQDRFTGNCYSIEPFTLHITPFSDTSFTLTATCDGGTAMILGDTGGTFTFNPAPGDGAVINPSTGEITGGTGGATYTVDYTISGACGNTTTENVTVLTTANTSFTMTATCDGGTATILGDTGGTFTFNPAPGDGAVINPTTGEVTGGTPGATYTIEYMTVGPCPATTAETVTVLPLEDASFSLTANCTGATATILGDTGGTFAFNPVPGDGAILDPSTGTITNGVTGVTYTLEYITAGPCPATSAQSVTVLSGLAVNNPAPLDYCDPDNDGFGVFDLSGVGAEVAAGDPSLTVTLHETMTNAQLGVGALDESALYNNIVAYSQILYIRVEDTGGCVGIGQLQIIVNDTPTIADAELMECDGDGSGIAEFDLTEAELDILNGLDPSQYTIIGYYENDADADVPTGAIPTPASYMNTTPGQQIVWVRVENNTTGCHSLAELELNVGTSPTVVQPTELSLCDDAIADEFTEFDLTVKSDEITAGDGSLQVTYYETQAAAESGTGYIDPATSYTNTSVNGNPANPQTLFVRVEDPSSGCYTLTTLTIRVQPNPTPTPSDQLSPLTACDSNDPGDMMEVFDLTQNEMDILAGENQSNMPNLTVTYHESASDADSGTAAIGSPASYNSSTRVVYVRVTNDLTGCYTVVYFDIIVDPVPVPVLDEYYVLCTDTNGTEVIGTPLMDTGLNGVDYIFEWSYEGSVISGAVGSSYEPMAPGAYSVLVTDVQTLCWTEVSTEVILSTPPVVSAEVTTEAFDNDQVIVVTATGGASGIYEYSLDNGPWQDSNTFTGVVPSGLHTVRARDIYGCGEGSDQVLTVDYPPYFTPNGDGYHDTWQIAGLENQSAAKIYIFDRYGKLLKQLSPNGAGWDGSFNGYPLPSSDYWFVIEYQEPGSSSDSSMKEFRSHFTLKR